MPTVRAESRPSTRPIGFADMAALSSSCESLAASRTVFKAPRAVTRELIRVPISKASLKAITAAVMPAIASLFLLIHSRPVLRASTPAFIAFPASSAIPFISPFSAISLTIFSRSFPRSTISSTAGFACAATIRDICAP